MAEVVLTPPESKRLLAKAIASLTNIKEALRSGYAVIKHGTTNAHIFEEITGKKPKPPFACGTITPDAMCADKDGLVYRMKTGYSHYWVIERGKILENPDLERIFNSIF